MDIVSVLTTLSNNYSENQRSYNDNVRRILNMLEDYQDFSINQRRRNPADASRVISAPPAPAPAPAPAVVEDSPFVYLNSPLLLRTFLQNLRNNTNNLVFEPQRQIPTSAQIRAATEIFNYSSSLFENADRVCPITLNPFREGECIARIRHCGHIFHHNALQRWFTQNSACPVCRHNILNTPPQPPQQRMSSATVAAQTQQQDSYNADTEDNYDDSQDNEDENNIASGESTQTTDLFSSLINLLDTSGVSLHNLDSYRRRTENGNVIDILYELNVPLGNIRDLI